MSIDFKQRSRSSQKAAFSRMNPISYSNFNQIMNAEFKAGIPSSREVLFTDKTMDVDRSFLDNIAPYNKRPFGIDLRNEREKGEKDV